MMFDEPRTGFKTKERSGDGEEMGFDLGLDFLVVDDDGRRKFDPGC